MCRIDLNSDQAVIPPLRLLTEKYNISPSALLAQTLAHSFVSST